ncbi:efflux RND transporter periplasmic adaptor subunit [Salidesulfovibrio brasiliensis]|uniref:efflux RND transporter periplasmic adaptor subunit n=1 Tax=Salidesulfovibrio brasiliensis TaxID=221711 RepID=UPI0006CFC3AB|nr:efflux RND transporter periplasmic adaptor subunit [Salidesulfovibrio brasiliensis]
MKRIACCLFLFAILVGCNGKPAAVEEPVRPVKTAVVQSGGVGKLWSFAGTAEDALETDLSFRVGGKIVDFPGNQIGKKFSKGEVIARLDPSDYELELRQAKANMEQIRASYIRAEADVKRIRQLYDRKVISKSELDQAEADFQSNKAQLSASAKKLDIARKQLTYTVLEAPFNGWIGSVMADIHQNVSSGQAVVSFNAGRQMKMYVSVPDILITHVNEGDEVEVSFDAIPGKIMKGRVMEVGVQSTKGSTYPVKVYLDNSEKLVRSGMSGTVSFKGKNTEQANVYVPAAAVVGEVDGTRSVWVVNPKDDTVSKQRVAIGELTDRGIEVLEGLKEGDVVVTRGVHSLHEGLKVRYQRSGEEA